MLFSSVRLFDILFDKKIDIVYPHLREQEMIGDFIKKQRVKRDITQGEAAAKVGVSRPTYIHIERGERDITVGQARKFAEIFDMSLEDFLGERETGIKVVLERGAKREPVRSEIRVTSENREKFRQVLLYVLSKVGGKPNVGETVLHKLLYFIDFDYYEKFEENLMGATYIKNHHGPTSVDLNAVIKDMCEKGELEKVRSGYFKYEQKKYLPLRKPDLGAFSAREVSHIDEVLSRHSDKNAREIEEYSHGDIPWRSAESGEPLSYESVFYRDHGYSVRNYEDEI